jgi:hypothetical protein
MTGSILLKYRAASQRSPELRWPTNNRMRTVIGNPVRAHYLESIHVGFVASNERSIPARLRKTVATGGSEPFTLERYSPATTGALKTQAVIQGHRCYDRIAPVLAICSRAPDGSKSARLSVQEAQQLWQAQGASAMINARAMVDLCRESAAPFRKRAAIEDYDALLGVVQ